MKFIQPLSFYDFSANALLIHYWILKKKLVHGTCADLNVETLRKETLVSSLTYVRSVGLSFPLAYIAIQFPLVNTVPTCVRSVGLLVPILGSNNRTKKSSLHQNSNIR